MSDGPDANFAAFMATFDDFLLEDSDDPDWTDWEQHIRGRTLRCWHRRRHGHRRRGIRPSRTYGRSTIR